MNVFFFTCGEKKIIRVSSYEEFNNIILNTSQRRFPSKFAHAHTNSVVGKSSDAKCYQCVYSTLLQGNLKGSILQLSDILAHFFVTNKMLWKF